MNTLVAFFFCVQTFLIQNVFSQCSGSYGSDVMNSAAYGSGISSSLGRGSTGFSYTGLGASGLLNTGNLGNEASSGAAYGGAGEGYVAVAGELPIAGNTAIIGQVPMQGAVSFSGNLPAVGSVIISGRCSCGCDSY